MTYAQKTTVTIERSKAEIEKIVTKAGATRFASYWEENSVVLAFQLDNRLMRFSLVLPSPDDEQFAKARTYRSYTRRGATTKGEARQKKWEQEIKRLWRALALCIKAKLESVESGIETLDEAFLAQIVLPGGKTVSQTIVPQIASQCSNGKKVPLLLPDV